MDDVGPAFAEKFPNGWLDKQRGRKAKIGINKERQRTAPKDSYSLLPQGFLAKALGRANDRNLVTALGQKGGEAIGKIGGSIYIGMIGI